MVRAGGLSPSGRIVSKFPAGYYDRLQAAFRAFFEAYTPEQLDSRQLYNLYDQWKKSCGVGRLVDIAVREGREARPDLHLGVCGEHGGDPESVHFFHEVGLDYVSCSPFRVPIARLEAGRAALSGGGSDSR